MTIEAPQSFVVREECQKAAAQNGFRRILGEEVGWATFGSTTVQSAIQLAAAGIHGPWFLALDHTGVIAELGRAPSAILSSGRAHYAFDGLRELYETVNRVYALSVSLPNAPLLEFESRVANLPRTTDAERMVVQRIGQDIFRSRLMDYWQGRCPLTGIADPALLRASHIVPWAECESDGKRLDVHNGLLLSALWDAAFDAGLVGFGDDGRVITSTHLTATAVKTLNLQLGPVLRGVTRAHGANLAWHRKRYELETRMGVPVLPDHS